MNPLTKEGKTSGVAADPPSTPGRFSAGERPGFTQLLLAVWDGFRLRCPSCSSGRLYEGRSAMHRQCQRCGAPFERYGEGDFVGAMVVAYSLAALFVTQVILVVNITTSMSVEHQLIMAAVIGLLFVLLLYRNMKGIWVAILLALLHWMK